MTSPSRRWVYALAGAGALAVLGGVVYATAPSATEFGWFAYEPLPDVMLPPPNPARERQHLIGLILVALGAVGVVAAFSGLTLRWRAARRSA